MGRHPITKSYTKQLAQYFGTKKRATFVATQSINLSKPQLVKLAVEEHAASLFSKHSNIVSVSDAYNGVDDYHVTIYLKDGHSAALPEQLSLKINGQTVFIPTEIITDAGTAIPHIAQSIDELSDSKSPNYYGSICCLVQSNSNPDFKGIVTSGHVFTNGDFLDYGGVIDEAERRSALINGNAKAKLFFQQMTYKQDVAILQLEEAFDANSSYISFAKGYHTITDADLKTTKANVVIASRQQNTREAFVLDYNVSFEISYFNAPQLIRNIILIGSTNDRNTSLTVTKGGDSGSCVYHKQTGQLIGMLLGGNNKFSFVLPLQDTLNAFNFKPL